MKEQIPISDSVREIVQRALAEFHDETERDHIPTIEQLLHRWDRFTSSVESGYSLDFDSYRNGIDTRWVIGFAINALEDYVSQPIIDVLSPIDDRFYGATVEADRPIGKRPEWIMNFYRRIPKTLIGEAQSLSELLE